MSNFTEKIITHNTLAVPIGDMIVSDNMDDVLVAYGLGSCVAVCLYDPVIKVGGMLHALLPSPPNGDSQPKNPAKFVDQLVKKRILLLVHSLHP